MYFDIRYISLYHKILIMIILISLYSLLTFAGDQSSYIVILYNETNYVIMYIHILPIYLYTTIV